MFFIQIKPSTFSFHPYSSYYAINLFYYSLNSHFVPIQSGFLDPSYKVRLTFTTYQYLATRPLMFFVILKFLVSSNKITSFLLPISHFLLKFLTTSFIFAIYLFISSLVKSIKTPQIIFFFLLQFIIFFHSQISFFPIIVHWTIKPISVFILIIVFIIQTFFSFLHFKNKTFLNVSYLSFPCVIFCYLDLFLIFS